MLSELATRLADVKARIEAAARRAGRDPSAVRLIAVSKTFDATAVAEAVAAGQRVFGENRVQEAAEKIERVRSLVDDSLEWHFIGTLQRNKAQRAVACFDVIHAVDRPALVDALARAARDAGRRPRILAQVNIDREPQKGGVSPEALPGLVDHIAACSELDLRGLMAIPLACDHPEQVRPSFRRLRELRDALVAEGTPRERLSELSMGMSSDFEIAIEEGATWVRVGTAIFGERRRA
jgi:pyridoxal phosphate enzyme (YggS family)